MRMLLTALAVILSGVASSATAEIWTTPDEFLTVTKPNDSEFTELPSPPSPFVGFWLSKDETLSLGVVVIDIPRQVKLNQSSAEEGLAEEVGGSVTRLPTRKVGGLEVWSMTAKTTDSELTQAMLRNEGKLYKLMAITNGAEPNTEVINAFMESVQLAKAPSIAAEDANGTSPSSQEGGIDLHNLSKRAGGVAFLAIIALLIYRATKKKPAND